MDKPTETSVLDDASLTGLPQSLKELVGQVAERKADFPDLIVALSPLINNGSALPTETALELSVALHDIEVEAVAEDALHRLVNQRNAPSCAINAAGAVLALNVAAGQLFGLHMGDGIGQLGVSDAEWQDCQRRLAEVAGSTMLKVTRPGHDALPMIMIGRYNHRYQVFVLTALQHHWPEAVDKALEALFQLTRSEREILSFLAQGQTAEQIAANRSTAVGTVRQQIKALLEKMGSSTQVQAATLAAAAANVLSDSPNRSDALLMNQSAADLSFKEFVRDGRRVGWRRFGAAAGHPVILLHGPFFGAGDYLADRQWAERLGLEVFALERPGYGRTDIPQRDVALLDTMVDDILTLMAREGLSKAAFLTHEIGVIPALAIAQRAPERISHILGVSAAPPFRELAQLNAMPSQQRIFIWAAQHAQWLVRLLIRLGMVRLRKLGPDHWMEAVFGEVESDMAILRQPELQPGIIGAYSFNVNQVGAGFEVDLQLMLSDWGDLIQQNHIPIHLLHGTDNQTTRLEYAEVFCQLNPHIQLTRVEGSGQTLAVAYPDVVYQRLAELINQNPKS